MATAESPAPLVAEPERRFLLYGVSWRFYEAFLDEVADRRIFLTYDRGNLELMSPGPIHGRSGSLLGRAIDILTEELNIPAVDYGITTFRREDLDRGLEPDTCYYLRNEAAMRDRERIDLTTDPPPDLAIEVDITRSSRNKLDVYAGLKFPEVWRYDGRAIEVHVLQADGRYTVQDSSPNFPFLPIDELERLLSAAATMHHTNWARSFRAWVRAQIAPRFEDAGDGEPRP